MPSIHTFASMGCQVATTSAFAFLLNLNTNINRRPFFNSCIYNLDYCINLSSCDFSTLSTFINSVSGQKITACNGCGQQPRIGYQLDLISGNTIVLSNIGTLVMDTNKLSGTLSINYIFFTPNPNTNYNIYIRDFCGGAYTESFRILNP